MVINKNLPRPDNPNQMELLEALLTASDPSELVIYVDAPSGDTMEMVIRYRELTWTEKSRCISAAMLVNPADGTASFRQDIYNKLVLQTIITDSPIPISDKILEKLSPKVGVQLEAIIPPVFGAVEEMDNSKKG